MKKTACRFFDRLFFFEHIEFDGFIKIDGDVLSTPNYIHRCPNGLPKNIANVMLFGVIMSKITTITVV